MFKVLGQQAEQQRLNAVKSKLMCDFKTAMKEVGIEKFKLRVEDMKDKKEKEDDAKRVSDAVASAIANAMPAEPAPRGILGRFI